MFTQIDQRCGEANAENAQRLHNDGEAFGLNLNGVPEIIPTFNRFEVEAVLSQGESVPLIVQSDVKDVR